MFRPKKEILVSKTNDVYFALLSFRTGLVPLFIREVFNISPLILFSLFCQRLKALLLLI